MLGRAGALDRFAGSAETGSSSTIYPRARPLAGLRCACYSNSAGLQIVSGRHVPIEGA